MDRLDIRRANWLDFCELDESAANIIGTNPIYYNLLPAAKKAKWMRSGDGVLLASPGNHLTNAMAFGKVNLDDVCFDNPVRWYYVCEKTDNTDYMLLDFLVDWNKDDIRKYKTKNSTDRRIKEQNITVSVYKGNDPRFWFDVKMNELEALFAKWDASTKTEGKRDTKTRVTYALCNSKNLDKIVYRSNGKLAGFQVFENFLGNVYWHVNVVDYEKIGKSCVAWTYPIEHYNGVIHYLGAGTDDKRLFEHKKRICRDNYITFGTVFVPSIAQSNKVKREEKILKLKYILNI